MVGAAQVASANVLGGGAVGSWALDLKISQQNPPTRPNRFK
jgi:hypothetical protein